MSTENIEDKEIKEESPISQKGITLDGLYDHIVKHMTPEEALKKLLSSSLINYQNLRFKEGEEIHPEFVIAMAAMELGWQIAVVNKKDDNSLNGLVVGTKEYMEIIFPKNK